MYRGQRSLMCSSRPSSSAPIGADRAAAESSNVRGRRIVGISSSRCKMSRLEMPDENPIYARSRGFVERSATGRARLVSAREGAGCTSQAGITPVGGVGDESERDELNRY